MQEKLSVYSDRHKNIEKLKNTEQCQTAKNCVFLIHKKRRSEKSAKEKAQAEITEQDIRATIDWDKTTEADSAGREFVILDGERVIVMNVGEYYDITITGLKGYNLTYSIKKTGNEKIKCIDINTLKTQSNDGIIYKRIYAKQEGENTVVFTREKDGVSKDTKTMIIRCIPKID